MRRRRLALLFAALLAVPAPAADLIVHHANVVTVDPKFRMDSGMGSTPCSER